MNVEIPESIEQFLPRDPEIWDRKCQSNCRPSLFKLLCFLFAPSGKFAAQLAKHERSLPESPLKSTSLKSED